MTLILRPLIAATFLMLSLPASGEPPPVEDLRKAVESNLQPAVELYREFLSLPNDALFPDDIDALNRWMEGAFGARGFETRQLPTAGSPALFAQRLTSPSEPTVLVYLQADGQPVDPVMAAGTEDENS